MSSGQLSNFTLCAKCVAGAIFGVAQFASVGYIFPALVAALVPIRSFFVSRVFAEDDLVYLDPMGETEEEAHDERVKYSQRQLSIDEVEHTDQPGFSDFHAEGIMRDIASKGSGVIESDDGLELTAEQTLTRRHQA